MVDPKERTAPDGPDNIIASGTQLSKLDTLLKELVQNYGGRIQKLPSMTAQEAHTQILALIEEVIIGEDENADWQAIWGSDGKKHKIDDPAVVERNKLRAEQRLRKDAL